MSELERVGGGLRAAEQLLAKKERVIALWVERVRRTIRAAERELLPILVNTIPAILDQLAQALSPDDPRRTATEGSTVATEHGGERVRLTMFRLDDLIAEYKALRAVLFEVLEEERPLSADERNRLNASLDQALMEACTGYALVQSKFRDELFAIVAHDLRNPLGVALVSANLIINQPTAEQVPAWAARIADNIGRVDRMVQDLLDAARVNAGARLELDLEACDLVEVVREALDNLQPKHGACFVVDAEEPVHGYFARDALRRAVENLATNAVKYGARGGTVTVAIRATYGRTILTVHNHGAPIPVEKQETLFRARGWGLGLAQVRAVAEAHGGSIGVDSTAARGTTFIIDIPVDARPYRTKPTTEGQPVTS